MLRFYVEQKKRIHFGFKKECIEYGMSVVKFQSNLFDQRNGVKCAFFVRSTLGWTSFEFSITICI